MDVNFAFFGASISYHGSNGCCFLAFDYAYICVCDGVCDCGCNNIWVSCLFQYLQQQCSSFDFG